MSAFDVTLFDSPQAAGERILRLEGDPFEQGWQHGRAAADLMALNLDVNKRLLAARTGQGLTESYREAATFIETYQPELWQEFRGMAEGSGFPFEDILLLNIKLVAILGLLRQECSQYARVITQSDGSKRTLIAKTRDMNDSVATEHVVVLRHYPNGLQMLEVHLAGIITLPGSIMTNKGFALGTSGVWCKRTPFDRSRLATAEIGTNGHLIAREAETLDDILPLYAKNPRLTGINNVVAVAGEVAAVEVTADQAQLIDRSDDRVVRTNHYLSPDFAALSPTPEENTSTYQRYHTITQRLESAATIEDFWKIAQCHDGYPQNSVCRHKDAAGKGSFTTYASVFCIEERKAIIGFGFPCEIAYQAD